MTSPGHRQRYTDPSPPLSHLFGRLDGGNLRSLLQGLDLWRTGKIPQETQP